MRRLGGRLRAVQADGAAGGGRGLHAAIGALVKEALEARAKRRAASAGEDASLFLGDLPAACRRHASQSDVKGLAGEIVAEAVLAECGPGEPFFPKWRRTGASVPAGMDTAMRSGGLLPAREPGHLHAPRPGRDARTAVPAAIAAAPRRSADRHTRRWLLWLRRRCIGAAGLGGADALPRKAGIIGEALSARGVSACAAAVLDARHGADAASAGQRPGPGTPQGMAGPAPAAVPSTAGLREETVLLIGRHC